MKFSIKWAYTLVLASLGRVTSGVHGSENPDKQQKTNAEIFRDRYTHANPNDSEEKGFAPPKWSVKFAEDKEEFEKYAQKIRVYVTKTSNDKEANQQRKKLVKNLLQQREPCTLGKSLANYDIHADKEFIKDVDIKDYLNHLDGIGESPEDYFDIVTDSSKKNRYYFKKAYYRTYCEKHSHKALPPNIALYIKTPFKKYDDKTYDTEENYKNLDAIHIISVIGYSFNKQTDDDFKYFCYEDEQGFPRITKAKEQELLQRYKEIFDKIFQCTLDLNNEEKEEDKKIKKIVLNYFGCGAFAWLYPPGWDVLKHDIWEKALQESCKHFKNSLKKAGVDEISITMPNDEKKWLKSKESPIKHLVRGFTSKLLDPIPKCIQQAIDNKKKNTRGVMTSDNTLFVNAWDPYTPVGNGHRSDKTIDGHFGCSTASAVLTYILTNLHLLDLKKYVLVDYYKATTKVATKKNKPLPYKEPPLDKGSLLFTVAIILIVFVTFFVDIKKVIAFLQGKDLQARHKRRRRRKKQKMRW